ncbi:MAG: OB-fold nucleic acid binding domain-containing protein [Nanoarchaeota archaeon]
MTEDIEGLKTKLVEATGLSKDQINDKLQEKLSSLGGLISEEGALHIIANEQNVVLGKPPSSELKLKDVLNGMKNVTVVAKVLRKYEPRTFGENNDGKVASLFMGDETSFMRLTFWNDKVDNLFDKINEDDVIEVQHAYSKENNGYVELHMGAASNCIVNPEGKAVTVRELNSQSQNAPEKKLQDITENDQLVNITATIVQVYDPRFFESCPECGKRLQQSEDGYECSNHGTKEPTYNYVMNLFLDDGTDNIRATVWKEQVNKLVGKEESEVLKLKDDASKLEEMKTDLLGRIIQAQGKVKKNTVYNNLEVVLFDIDPNPDPSTVAGRNASEKQTLTTKQQEHKSHPESQQEKGTPSQESNHQVNEERMTGEEEELPSIDDIDDAV